MIKKLALHSYTIVRILFGFSFMAVVLLQSFIYDNVPKLIFYFFFLITGIFIGYTIAYFAIKYLNKEDFKNKLPMN